MSNPDKHPLQSILESTDHADRVRSYSGRAMRGEMCLGVVISCTLGELFADVMGAALEAHQVADGDDPSDPLTEIAESFRDMRTDSMGRDTIVYFPSVTFVNAAGEVEDDDDGLDQEECDS